MNATEIKVLFEKFSKSYDAEKKNKIWYDQSQTFRNFWEQKIVNGNPDSLTDDDIDVAVKILDRNGKGNTKKTEAIARVMIPQGAWRRMFHEICKDNELSSVISSILYESDVRRKAEYIDNLYQINSGRKNNLTGKSGNAINAMLAAHDPFNNLSMISLKDRYLLIEYMEFSLAFNIENASLGTQFIETNRIIIEGFKQIGIEDNARTISRFFYNKEAMKPLWKDVYILNRTDKKVNVTIPSEEDNEEENEDVNIESEDGPRESIQIQSLLAKIGSAMGLKIWLPKSDRSRVLENWFPEADVLLDTLPINYDPVAMKTIENIDVLWLNKRTILRAFEVEHTTSIYSGILRMADLLALIPNIDIKLHIVAPLSRKDKVLEEIQRPVFSLLERGPMAELCTYLSYDSIKELASHEHLSYLSNEVVEEYTEIAE